MCMRSGTKRIGKVIVKAVDLFSRHDEVPLLNLGRCKGLRSTESTAGAPNERRHRRSRCYRVYGIDYDVNQ